MRIDDNRQLSSDGRSKMHLFRTLTSYTMKSINRHFHRKHNYFAEKYAVGDTRKKAVEEPQHRADDVPLSAKTMRDKTLKFAKKNIINLEALAFLLHGMNLVMLTTFH